MTNDRLHKSFGVQDLFLGASTTFTVSSHICTGRMNVPGVFHTLRQGMQHAFYARNDAYVGARQPDTGFIPISPAVSLSIESLLSLNGLQPFLLAAFSPRSAFNFT